MKVTLVKCEGKKSEVAEKILGQIQERDKFEFDVTEHSDDERVVNLPSIIISDGEESRVFEFVSTLRTKIEISRFARRNNHKRVRK